MTIEFKACLMGKRYTVEIWGASNVLFPDKSCGYGRVYLTIWFVKMFWVIFSMLFQGKKLLKISKKNSTEGQ